MPVLVETDSGVVPSLLRAMPAGSHAVAAADRMYSWLDQHNDEYVVALGPSLPLELALSYAEELRVAKPTVSVILLRAIFDTEALTQAMHAGVRDVVASDDEKGLTKAVERAHELYLALRGPGGARQQGRIVTVFSPKGGVGKTTSSVNLALALADKGRAQGLPGRPRPRLRRRRDHHAAVPDALDRAGSRLRGLHRPGDDRRTADPARGVAERARRAGTP